MTTVIKQGFINKTGAWVIELDTSVLTEIGNFSESLVNVKDPVSGKWGYMDNIGRWIIEAQFADAEPFSAGLAQIKDENGKCGYIDQSGKLVIDATLTATDPFVGKYARVWDADNNLHYIDVTGKQLPEPA